MPRKWNRKTANGQFSEDLNAAIATVYQKRLSKKEVCKIYKMGRATPKQYLAAMSPEG